MRLRRHGHLFQSSFKRLTLRPPIYSPLYHQIRNSSSGPDEVKDVAIVGGGITGLASTYFISKYLPKAKITVYEASNRAGGWLHSKHEDVPGGKILFEQGPRTLRPGTAAVPTAHLIQELGLIDDVLFIRKDHPSARNRFIYFPDHLQRLPAPPLHPTPLSLISWGINKLFTDPMFRTLAKAAVHEFFTPARPKNMDDQSIGHFVARRLSPELADNFASAVMHGIYAGDVYKLSMKTILSTPWHSEGRFGGILKAALSGSAAEIPARAIELPQRLQKENMSLDPKFQQGFLNSSVYTLINGLQQLINRLEEVLRGNTNITFMVSTPVKSIQFVPRKEGEKEHMQVTVSTDPEASTSHTHVISTLYAKTLSKLTPKLDNKGSILHYLSSIPAVTVMVVNLWFQNPSLLPVQGFGYLIPRSVPFDQNPERALGVIFDSCTAPEQDTVKGTKVTVMLGGHWWNGWEEYPSPEEGAIMARTILARHLGIIDEPFVTNANLMKDCIPQYHVGHSELMKASHENLAHKFNGRLRVAGNSYSGVGVQDCILAAWKLALGLRDEQGAFDTPRTGLEDVVDEKFIPVMAVEKARFDGKD